MILDGNDSISEFSLFEQGKENVFVKKIKIVKTNVHLPHSVSKLV